MPANRKTLRSEEERQDDDGGVRRPRLFDLSDVDDDDGEQEGHVDEADADAVTDENREIEHSQPGPLTTSAARLHLSEWSRSSSVSSDSERKLLTESQSVVELSSIPPS
jgi:hypothetical protein